MAVHNGSKDISENRQKLLPSTDKKLASESQEIAHSPMWSKPEYESKSVSTCSLSTHCTHCTCLFHEQRLQALPGKSVKCLQVSKTQTSVQTWRENQGPESIVKNPWSSTESRSVPTVILGGQRKETELVTFWWKLSTRKTVRQEDIQKVSMVLTTLHHPKEEI